MGNPTYHGRGRQDHSPIHAAGRVHATASSVDTTSTTRNEPECPRNSIEYPHYGRVLGYSEDIDIDKFSVSTGPPQKRKRSRREQDEFLCDELGCGKTFDRAADLAKHKKYHIPQSERKYACEECGKRFHFPKDLKRHLRTHDREPLSQTVPLRPALQLTQGTHAQIKGAASRHDRVDPTLEDVLDGVGACFSDPDIQRPANQGIEPPRPYTYQPLDATCIRLLTLMPVEDKASDIYCSIDAHDLNVAPPYVALSYTWGDATPCRTIQIGKSVLRIRERLHTALLHLRDELQYRPVWIDAVCINQDDHQEKSTQVSMIAEIFQNAQMVYVWLGPHADYSEAAWDYMTSVSTSFDSERKQLEYQSRDTHIDYWGSLACLLNRPWFSRLWVIQEIALAKEATICCGNALMSWSRFETAAFLLDELDQWEKGTIRQPRYDTANLIVAESGALRLIQKKGEICRLDGAGKLLNLRYSFADLVSSTWFFNCSDSRDRIYALLGLASFNTKLMPDYTVSLTDLYKQAFRMIMDDHSAANLDLICRPWAEGTDLPSWLPNCNDGPYGRVPHGYGFVRKNADPLVGMTSHDGPIYNASLVPFTPLGYQWKFPEGDSSSLCVTGFVLDTIQEHTDASQRGFIPQEWLSFAGPNQGSDYDLENLTRILVADRGPSGRNMPAYYTSAFRHIQSLSTGDGIDVANLKTHPSISVVKFINRIESVIWNRRLFRSKSYHKLGLCPKASRANDLICILYGASVPIVLRPDADHYTFIGECYLHDMMDGQAIAIKRESQLHANGSDGVHRQHEDMVFELH